MPIYEYECDLNKHRFEKWQSMSDDPIKECPTCGSPVHKIFHPAGIIFKGSGWYITDSRKPSPGESSGKSDSSGETKSDSKTEKTPDAKSETKSDAKSEKSSNSDK